MARGENSGYTSSMVLRVSGITAIVAAALAAAWWAFPSVETMVAAIEWMQNSGPIGHGVFVLAYGLHSVLMLPASWSHGTAGFLYGPIAGPVIASALATFFAGVNFTLGRTLLRSWVERKISASPRLRALDSVTGSGGAWLVFLVRLPPLSPFNPMSYILGATRVRFSHFLLGTWVGGLLPVTFFSWLGASASDLAAIFAGEAASGSLWVKLAPLAITLVVTVYVTRYAKRELDAALAAQEALAE